jgi:putative DNA primase/helicase
MKGNIWAKVLGRLENSVKLHDFREWLAPTSQGADDGSRIEVRVPSDAFATWLPRHYGAAIQEALSACGRPDVDVEFVVGPPIADGKAKNGKGPQGKELQFEQLEPWSDHVAGPQLLADLVAAFERFITLPPHAATALALWVIHTFAHDAAYCSPVLAITSPMKRCGKTSLLIVLGSLVHRRQFTSNLTPGGMFRVVDRFQPTLLIDEADTFINDNDTLRGLLNSGYTKQTAWLIRNVGDQYDPRQFYTWCPKVIAAIGRLPSTIEDRSIVVKMRRQKNGDDGYRSERLRVDRIDSFNHELRRRAARWADDHIDGLHQRDPDMPAALDDRAADSWRALLAIADEAGGEWPERARRAAETLSGGAAEDDQEPGVELLRDLADLIYPPEPNPLVTLTAGDNGLVSTTEIVRTLTLLPDRPWGTWRGDKPLTPHALARLLKPLGVRPGTYCKVGDAIVRGYPLDAFDDAIYRYLPSKAIKRSNPNEIGPESPFQSDQTDPALIALKSEKTPENIGVRSLDRFDRGKTGISGNAPGVIDLEQTLKSDLKSRRQLKAVPTPAHPARRATGAR